MQDTVSRNIFREEPNSFDSLHEMRVPICRSVSRILLTDFISFSHAREEKRERKKYDQFLDNR